MRFFFFLGGGLDYLVVGFVGFWVLGLFWIGTG